jgi:hypothetical protein
MRTRRDKRGVDLETWMRRRRRRRMFLAAVVVGMIAGVAWQWSRPPAASALTGRRLGVLEVIGPTALRVAAGEGPAEVALLGVFVPETGEAAAIAWLREQVGGGHVMVEFDAAPVRDRAGRMAAYVYRDEMMLNEAMLRAGVARADDRAVHRLSEWFARLDDGANRRATP